MHGSKINDSNCQTIIGVLSVVKLSLLFTTLNQQLIIDINYTSCVKNR